MHKYFRKYRVVREDIEDGKTEWFLLTIEDLIRGTWKIRRAMEVLFGDIR